VTVDVASAHWLVSVTKGHNKATSRSPSQPTKESFPPEGVNRKGHGRPRGPRPPAPPKVFLSTRLYLSHEARAGLSQFQIPGELENKLFDLQKAAVKIAAHTTSTSATAC
jgi:hypothetical protein